MSLEYCYAVERYYPNQPVLFSLDGYHVISKKWGNQTVKLVVILLRAETLGLIPTFSEEQPELTSTMDASVVMNLADSTSDHTISAEARRVMTQHKKEREKLGKLGNLVPIDTEMSEIEAARLKSAAKPLPLRPKLAQSKCSKSTCKQILAIN